MSRPKSAMRPPVGACSPLMRLNSVVLPAPFGPMIARRSPGWISRLTSSTARSPPNAFVTPERLSALAGATLIALAVLARRDVPAVHGVLHVLVGLVVPELRDIGVGLQHGIPELAVDLLHLADVDVLDRVAVAVELDRPPRRVRDLDLAERGEELLAVLEIAVDGLGGLVDPAAGRVAGLRVVGRDLP